MSLDHILLGILREPRSGYEIKAEFDQVFRHFWQAQQSQIYRTLKRLERDDCLTSRLEPSDQGPDRRVYQVTARGRRHLRDWLSGDPVVGEDRHTYLAQVWFLEELNDLEASLDFFRDLHERLVVRRDELRAIEAGWSAEDERYPDFPGDDVDFHRQLTLQLGLMKTATLVEWAEDCIARIERRMRKANTKKDRGDDRVSA